MKLRHLGVLVAAGALAMGIWLGKWIPTLGWGAGSGGGLGFGGPLPLLTSPTDAPLTHIAAEPPPAGTKPATAGPAAGNVVHVLIDGRAYLLDPRSGQTPTQTVALQELVARVRRAAGNEDGIRAYVRRRGSARASAELALRDELRRAGVPDEAIRWEEALVP